MGGWVGPGAARVSSVHSEAHPDHQQATRANVHTRIHTPAAATSARPAAGTSTCMSAPVTAMSTPDAVCSLPLLPPPPPNTHPAAVYQVAVRGGTMLVVYSFSGPQNVSLTNQWAFPGGWGPGACIHGCAGRWWG